MSNSYAVNPVGVTEDGLVQSRQLNGRSYRLIIECPISSTLVRDGARLKKNVSYQRVTLGAGSAETGMPMHISFSVDRTDGKVQNMGQIQVWNINRTLFPSLMQEGTKVYLYAGYGAVESLPMVFQGTVVKVTEQLAGADRIYTIDAVDGFQELQSAPISVAFQKGTKIKDIYEEIAMRIGVLVSYTDAARRIVNSRVVQKGFSAIGRASDVLSIVSEHNGLVWAVEAGALFIKGVSLAEAQTSINLAYHLSAKTGLIGLPERDYESSVTTNENTASGMRYIIYGYTVKFFMNAALQIRDVVYLDSSVAKGLFQIYQMHISGDNYGGDWVCTAKLCEYHPAAEQKIGEEYDGGYVQRLLANLGYN